MHSTISPDVFESGNESMSVGASIPRWFRPRIVFRVTYATDKSKSRPKISFLNREMVLDDSFERLATAWSADDFFDESHTFHFCVGLFTGDTADR
jgi:hypothetical protein